MAKQLKKRSEVNIAETWDLTSMYKTESLFEKEVAELVQTVQVFKEKYQGKLNDVTTINESLTEMRTIQEKLIQTSTYVRLHISGDRTDEKNVTRQGAFNNESAKISNLLSFYLSELIQNDTEVLIAASEADEENKNYILDLIRDKPHSLSPELESAFAQFSQALNQPYQTYLTSKIADMKFPDFTVEGKAYPNSFVLFENEWEYEQDHNVRRAAYEAFYSKLAEYQGGFAETYKTQIMNEKAMATLKGFDSVLDYLLHDQKVTVDMYNRQIDLIMEHLAPAMRKFATLLKDINGLEKMTYADLKLAVDFDFEPIISPDESKKYLIEGLAALGEEYIDMVERAYDERWIDFPQIVGKDTGAFCSSPYGFHPFILISWTERMREVFVMAHELGHAGHFYLAQKAQNIYNTRPSMYFIEAPSTMNELIVADKMIKDATDPRMKRWVYSTMISRTYYHNFVTHLLEAAYQREVYRYVDEGKPLSAKVLNELTVKVIRDFWGDTVEVPDYAGLTWMRQPHYYMGLYPYTYSAGLTIATCASTKLLNDEITIDQWKDVLRAGGTKDPMGLAAMVDVDLSTAEPLMETIAYIENMIEQIISLTDEITL
jgi:oligoendopeptidase F